MVVFMENCLMELCICVILPASPISREQHTTVCAINYDLKMALVTERLENGDGRGEIVGVGRLIRDTETNSGEFALIVSDNFQRRGLGAELLRRTIEISREERLDTIQGWIAPSNVAMQNLSRKLGFDVRFNRAQN
jgi:acetyltransferase